jgi:fido (protein-threonine AMPylation protein)
MDLQFLRRIVCHCTPVLIVSGVLREKGQTLYNSYQGLKKHLEDLRSKISGMQRENAQQVDRTNAIISYYSTLI